MPRPKYAKPDSNQLTILRQLDALGITYVVTSQLPCKGSQGKPPLDFFTLAYDRKQQRDRWIQWECKVDNKSSFTEEESEWLDNGSEVFVCYTLDDILAAYGM